MVPSGDDGSQTVDEASELCRRAAERGTGVLYVTPHVNDDLPLTESREQMIRQAAGELAFAVAPYRLQVRVGFELHPSRTLARQDLSRYRLEGCDAVLVECPLHEFSASTLDDAVELAQEVEQQGFVPVLAHPERSREIFSDPRVAANLASRNWPLQVTAASLLGANGPLVETAAWQLLETGAAGIVASDGHNVRRPPFLDGAFAASVMRLGAERAIPLFDGQNLAGGRPQESAATGGA